MATVTIDVKYEYLGCEFFNGFVKITFNSSGGTTGKTFFNQVIISLTNVVVTTMSEKEDYSDATGRIFFKLGKMDRSLKLTKKQYEDYIKRFNIENRR